MLNLLGRIFRYNSINPLNVANIIGIDNSNRYGALKNHSSNGKSKKAKALELEQKQKQTLIEFNTATLDEKIQICKDSILASGFKEECIYDLKYFLKEAANGENPKQFDYEEFEAFAGKEIPKYIIEMIDKIYTQTIVVKGRQKAIEIFTPAYQDYLKAINNQINPVYHSESSILLSLNEAFKYLIESKSESNIQTEIYKELGDFFFNSTLHLKDEGKISESELILGMTMKFYEKAKAIIPVDINDNWKQYSSHKTRELRTDFPTSHKDIDSLFSEYI